MEDQLTPREFIVFLFALFSGGVLAAIFWYWKRETGPVAWVLAALRFVKRSWNAVLVSRVHADVSRQTPIAGINSPGIGIASGITGLDLNIIPSDLTYEEQVTILARQMLPTGKPRYSGKKIYSFVGGNYNDFVALMQRLRPKDSEPAEEPTVYTPYASRPTKASYYQDDPQLEFQPPPR